MKPHDSYSLNTLANSLAVALAAPAMFLGQQAMAQSGESDVTQLAPVKVEGEGSAYQSNSVQSRKMTAPLQDMPRTVQVVPLQVIQDQAATSLQDVLRNSPGITFGAGEGGRAGGDLPIIRGQNSTGSIFVDGVRDPGTQTRDVFNLEQVEITKGPDSVYSGRGGAGGSINLVSKAPKLRDFAEGSVQVGTDNNYRVTADGNWKFDEKAPFRLNLMGAKGDIAGRDDAVDFERFGIAPSLLLGAGTDTRITLSYYHYQDDSMPDYSMPYDPRTGQPVTESMGVSRKAFYGLSERDFQKTRTDIGTFDFQHDITDKLQIRNVIRYGKSLNDFAATNPDDSRGNVVNGFVSRSLKSGYYETDTFVNQTDLTGEFATGSLEHSFNVGFEYSNLKQDKDAYTEKNTPATKCTSVNWGCASLWHPDPDVSYGGSLSRVGSPARYSTDTVAVYGFDTIKFNEQWQASLGARWESYDTKGSNLAPARGSPAGTPNYSAKYSDTLFNYQAGVAYKPLPNGTVYLTYATASTPPTLGTGDGDVVSSANNSLKPEESTTIEFGTKWQVFDERLSLSAALFHDERQNANVAISATETAQVGKTRVQGLELGFSGEITPAWNVFGGYTFMDSELVKGAYNSGMVGQDVPNTPRHAFMLWSTYKVLPQFTVGGGVYYVSKVYGRADDTFTAAGLPNERSVPAYWRFDAMASYQINDHLTAQLNLFNVFDKTYYTKAYTAHYAALGAGRSALLSLNIKY